MDSNLKTYYFMVIDKYENKSIIGIKDKKREDAYIFLQNLYKEEYIVENLADN